MTRRQIRGVLALPALAALGVFLYWGFSGLPPFGDYHGFYGHLINDIALPERHTTNAVTATVFDYRGFDTLGEEFILFAAVSGVVLLLRKSAGDRDGEEAPEDKVESDAVRLFGLLALAGGILVGLWLAAYGLVTPGGGFQGGVAIASGFVVLFLCGSYLAWSKRTSEEVLDPLEGAGAGTYAIVGLAALVSGLPFLANLLGPGRPGTLVSGGSQSFINWGVALEVAAANTVLFKEFLAQYVVPIVKGGERG